MLADHRKQRRTQLRESPDRVCSKCVTSQIEGLQNENNIHKIIIIISNQVGEKSHSNTKQPQKRMESINANQSIT